MLTLWIGAFTQFSLYCSPRILYYKMDSHFPITSFVIVCFSTLRLLGTVWVMKSRVDYTCFRLSLETYSVSFSNTHCNYTYTYYVFCTVVTDIEIRTSYDSVALCPRFTQVCSIWKVPITNSDSSIVGVVFALYIGTDEWLNNSANKPDRSVPVFILQCM